MDSSREKHLVVRVDASTKIGIGHLMRCLALAQSWKDAGGKVVFITTCQIPGLPQRLHEEGFDIHLVANPYPDHSDWILTKSILADYPDSWLVLDGYHFDEFYQHQVKDTGHRLLVIDDNAHHNHYYADIVLNQNLHAEQLHYSCEPDTRLLLGTRYALLRKEFLEWRNWQSDIPEIARRVLVTLGGSDPDNNTLKIVQALQQVDVPELDVAVVIGASNPHAEMLEIATKQSCIPIRLISNVRNMPELMAWADAAVSASGSTAWELAYMGVPAALVIQADNQRGVAEELHQTGAALNLGWAHEISTPELVEKLDSFLTDSKRLQAMSQRSKTLVDGEGAQRVIATIMACSPDSPK